MTAIGARILKRFVEMHVVYSLRELPAILLISYKLYMRARLFYLI